MQSSRKQSEKISVSNNKMTYYSDFKDLDNNSLRLEIQTSGSGSTEVKLLSDAMTIEYSGESIFDALRPSRASVNLFVSDIIPSMFSGTLNSVSVKLYKNSSLFWFGYVQPNVYTQSYQGNYDTLTIEAIDTVAQLENVDYTYIDKTDSVGIFSFLDVLSHCFDAVDTNHVITDLYVDSTIAVNSSSPILDNLYIKERNFFDEKEEAMKCDEVVSSIMQYLGLTLIQYKNAFYAISTEKLNSAYTLTHYTYSSNTWQQGANVTLTLPIKTTSQIGQSGSNVTVSLGGVYNKVTVIANNNPLDNILPEQDDEDDIINQNADPNCQYEEDYSAPDGTAYKLVSGFFKSKQNWDYTKPYNQSGEIDEVTLSNRDSIIGGIFWQNVADYKTADGEPASLNRKLYITMTATSSGFYTNLPQLTLNTPKTMILDGGYLIVNMKYKFSTDIRAHSAVKSMYDSAQTFGSCSDLTWTSNTDYVGAAGWPNNTMFQAKLTIGDYYYNGAEWGLIADLQARQTYYNNTYSGWGWDGAGTTRHWFRTWNSTYNLFDYVTEDFYNSFSGQKERGDCAYANANYVYNANLGGAQVYIPADFYNELFYGDSFFLVHQNQTTEPIYDVEYSLTNTVSYKMQIVESSAEGLAIKCPDDYTMYGQLNFQIFACGKLGTNPQPRTDIANTTLRAIHISDLSIAYSKSSAQADIYHPSNIDPDTIYSNTVDENYCKELEDIELRVNTQNDWATSYSYVIGQSDGQFKYINSLTFGSSQKKPEERLVQRLVNYYKQPKFIFSRDVHNQSTEIHPFQPIAESIGGSTKQLVTTSATYNVSQNTVNITTNEI